MMKNTKCINCDKYGPLDKMYPNPDGAGYICHFCYTKSSCQENEFLLRLVKIVSKDLGDEFDTSEIRKLSGEVEVFLTEKGIK
jgi:hypothetical protein